MMGAGRARGRAEQGLDGLHGGDETFLLGGPQALEAAADIVTGDGIEVREGGVTGVGQREVLAALVAFRRARDQQVPSLEPVQRPAELPLVEAEPLAKVAGGDVGAVGDLVEEPGVGECEGALGESLVEQADLARVETVEVADGADAGGGDAGHGCLR